LLLALGEVEDQVQIMVEILGLTGLIVGRLLYTLVAALRQLIQLAL